MALKLVRKGPVVFFYNGEKWEIMGGTPEGWHIWGLGRIYPPPGVYWLELTETSTVELRPSETGVKIAQQKVVNVKDGDYLLSMYAKKGDALMLTYLSALPSSQVRFTLDPSTTPWVTWSAPTVPWIERENHGEQKGTGIILTPGKYRVEPIGGIVRYWSADGSTSTDITSPTEVSAGTLRAYSGKTPATNVVITQLA